MEKHYAVVKPNFREAEIYKWTTYKDYGFEWYSLDNNGDYMPSHWMTEYNTKYYSTLEEAEVGKLEANHKQLLQEGEEPNGTEVVCKNCQRRYDIDDEYLYEGNEISFDVFCVCGEHVKGDMTPLITVHVIYK